MKQQIQNLNYLKQSTASSYTMNLDMYMLHSVG